MQLEPPNLLRTRTALFFHFSDQTEEYSTFKQLYFRPKLLSIPNH
jgi:hypothetical protein